MAKKSATIQASDKATKAEAEVDPSLLDGEDKDNDQHVPREDDDEAQINKDQMPPVSESSNLQCGFAFGQLDAAGQFDETANHTSTSHNGKEVEKEKQPDATKASDDDDDDDDWLIKALVIAQNNEGQQFDQLGSAGRFHNESITNTNSKEAQLEKMEELQEPEKQYERQSTELELTCGVLFDVLDQAGTFDESTKSNEARRAAATSTCATTDDQDQKMPELLKSKSTDDNLDPEKNSKVSAIAFGLPAGATSHGTGPGETSSSSKGPVVAFGLPADAPAGAPAPATAPGETVGTSSSGPVRPPRVVEPGAYQGTRQGMRRINKIDFSLVGSVAANCATHISSNLTGSTQRDSSSDENSSDGFDGDKHPVARPVTEEAPRDLEAAQPVSQEELASSGSQDRHSKSNKLVWSTAFLFALVGIVILVLALRSGRGQDIRSTSTTTSSSNTGTTPPPTSVIPISPEDYIRSLLPSYTQAAIARGPRRPQARALDWMLNDPNLVVMDDKDANHNSSLLLTYSDDRLVQRFALATIYYATRGQNWTNQTNWLSYEPEIHECDWAMTDPNAHWYSKDIDDIGRNACNGTEAYQNLGLGFNRLVGRIPPELALLTGLLNVDVSNNELLDTLPTQIAQLTHLKLLHLFANELVGQIPTQIGLMTDLEILGIERNMLTGPIPSEIGKLSKLNWLWGFYNQLSGSLPTEMGNLNATLMRRLELFGNSFTGTLPSELGLLTKLGELTLDHNQLTGTIPTEFGMLNVGLLFLQANDLTGSIPTELGLMKESYRLYLYSNQLTGQIPTELGLTYDGFGGTLEILLLHDNQLTGPIPSELGNLHDLAFLYLNFNQQTGIVPPDWKGALELRDDLERDQNNFSGPLPSTLGRLSKLKYLWLPNNALSSTLPSELGLLAEMVAFSAAQNEMLSGTIPEELTVLATNGSLSHFDVTGTAISGTIPADLCLVGPDSLFAFDCQAELCGCDCECFATNP